MKRSLMSDPLFIQAAIIGLNKKRQEITEKIGEIKSLLAGTGGAVEEPAPRVRSRYSAAARQRIAAAQKRRWRNFRKAKELAKKKGGE